MSIPFHLLTAILTAYTYTAPRSMRHGPSYSASLGGKYWYDDVTDVIIREDGSSFQRPSNIAIASLISPAARTSAQHSIATGYSSSNLEGPWYNAALGGEYKYNRQVDEFVCPDGRRLPRPSTMARPILSSQTGQ